MAGDQGAAVTTQQQAYWYLREHILNGRYEGGERVNPAKVADELGISRMPVREAIRQLDAEGLVTIRPNRGAIVTILTPTDIEELFEMRAVLEALAIRLAMPQLVGEALDDLVHLRDRMERVRGETKQWLQRHHAFHDHICQLSNRPRLTAEIARLRAAVQPYLQVYISVHHVPEMEGYEHDTLIDAIRSRNPSVAEVCMRDHILRAARGVIDFLDSRNPPAAERRKQAAG
jgi:DNA-binding GntR family transcriptional regulator